MVFGGRNVLIFAVVFRSQTSPERRGRYLFSLKSFTDAPQIQFIVQIFNLSETNSTVKKNIFTNRKGKLKLSAFVFVRFKCRFKLNACALNNGTIMIEFRFLFFDSRNHFWSCGEFNINQNRCIMKKSILFWKKMNLRFWFRISNRRIPK